jgi:hypothetical protein
MPPEGTTGGASRGSFPALQQQSEGIDLQTIENELLPQKIKDFEQSSANLDQIATYCRSLYASPNIPRAQYEEMLAETRGYVQQSISSLAYQIASSAETLQQYLNEQLLVLGDQVSEIEMISLVRSRLP